MGEAQTQLTHWIALARDGDAAARQHLIDAVYAELRRIAGGFMRRERPDHTLQPTALVNESLLRLLQGDALRDVRDRAYLFAAAAQAMRRVLVDHARARFAAKRGGGAAAREPLDAIVEQIENQSVDLLGLDEALETLRTLSQRQYDVVMLRFFGGLSVPETAEHLDVSVGTVENDFRIARAWLRSRFPDAP